MTFVLQQDAEGPNSPPGGTACGCLVFLPATHAGLRVAAMWAQYMADHAFDHDQFALQWVVHALKSDAQAAWFTQVRDAGHEGPELAGLH